MAAPLLYFAYGSNMLSPRLTERVGQIHVVGRACLPGYQLAFHKRGADGSAKCDMVAVAEDAALVHGVMFAMDANQRARLDAFEGPGYAVSGIQLRVSGEAGPVPAITYLARPEYVQSGLRPYTWYKAIVLAGARRHGLPQAYVATIEAIAAMEDPDPARALRNQAALDAD